MKKILICSFWCHARQHSTIHIAGLYSKFQHRINTNVLVYWFFSFTIFFPIFGLSYFSTILDFHFLHFLSLQIQCPIHTIPLILQFTAVLHNDMVVLHTNCFYSSYSFIFAFLLWLFAGHYRSALFLPPTMGTRIP